MIDGSDAAPPVLPPPARLAELMADAARLGRDDMVPALLQAGVDIDAPDARGYTPLILASYNGHVSTTRLLLDHGADIAIPDTARGNTPLMGVVFKGYDAIAGLLIEAGAAIDQRNAAGQTALMLAALLGRTAMVDMLLAAGADRAAVDSAGNTALSVAQAQGNDAMIARLTGA